MSTKSIAENEDTISDIPTYPDIVYTFEPAIKYVVRFLRILQWKQGYSRQSIALLLIWTFFWFHTHIVFYTLPIWVMLLIDHAFNKPPPVQEKDTTVNALDRLTTELKELQLELSSLIPSTTAKTIHFKQWCRSLFALSLGQKLLRGVSVYLVWTFSLKLLGISTLVWLTGMLILTWNSSFVRVICLAYHRAAFILRHAGSSIQSVPQKTMTSSLYASKKEHYDRYYRFNVIEHQRWWPHKGWTTLLPFNERPEWSDEYLARVPSIHKFSLPPSTIKLDKKTQMMTRIAWQWTCKEWKVDDNRNVDKDGWEYGSWDWKSWGSKSSGLRVLTRRRHWVRNACLVVQQQEEQSVTPITIQRSSSSSTSSAAVSLSTSLSSEDSSSYLCTTPTTMSFSPSSDLLHRYQRKSYSTSTISLNHHQAVEPISDTCTVDSHFWLHR